MQCISLAERDQGHIARVSRDKSCNKGQKSQGAHCVQEDSENSENSLEDEVYAMFTVRDPATNQDVHINSLPVKMELDTGASVSVVTYSTYQDIKKRNLVKPLQPTTVRLKTCTGEAISVLGKGQLLLSVLVVDPNLMGRNWLRELKVTLHSIEGSSALSDVLKKHLGVYQRSWLLTRNYGQFAYRKPS